MCRKSCGSKMENRLSGNQSLIREIKQLEERIPPVSDKALIDLVNGFDVSRDILRYRKRRKFWDWLFDQCSRDEEKRQLLFDENMLVGQENMTKLVMELTDSLRISHVAVEITQQSLLEARQAIRIHSQELRMIQEQIEKIVSYLDNHEERLRHIELKLTVKEDFERIITAWMSNQTYVGLPWIMQVMLLAREVFSSSVVLYELGTGNKKTYRDQLSGNIFANSKRGLPERKNVFGLADEIEEACFMMGQNDLALLDSLLDIRSIAPKRLLDLPHTFIIGTALESALIPAEIRPAKVGRYALEICRQQLVRIDRTTNAEDLVNAIIHETANDCLAIMSARKETLANHGQ